MSAIAELDPQAAHELLASEPEARLIDVRSRVEFEFVGHPIGAVHVPWKEFPDWSENPAFVDEVKTTLGDALTADTPLLLICRSGARSMSAARALADAGFTRLYNVAEGFEGDLDDNKHRGNINGWRQRDLPWEQS